MDDKSKTTFRDVLLTVLKRLSSPVIWLAFLNAFYIAVEQGDFSNPRTALLAIISALVSLFTALNNPTDRDNF